MRENFVLPDNFFDFRLFLPLKVQKPVDRGIGDILDEGRRRRDM